MNPRQWEAVAGEAAWKERVATIKVRGPIPHHIAMIMDGNGRWARRRGLPRAAGHRAGISTVRTVLEACGQLGVGMVTLYGFSTENWKRPREEVEGLMSLLMEFARREMENLVRNNVRVRTIGHLEDLPAHVAAETLRVVEQTRHNTGLDLILAINYGARQELADAARSLAVDAAAGRLQPEAITPETVQARLYTHDLPDPDLVIRTSGEMRISNFLLWQSAYAELWFTEVCWPDFRREHLAAAVEAYQGRRRRFGGLQEDGGVGVEGEQSSC